MTMTRPTTLADPYELVSVRAVAAPNDQAGAQWHRYEIAQGPNRIVGYRQGRLDSVTIAVEAIVVQLNQRRVLQRGRVHISRKPKSASA
jgi:hypothetical protein